eukprot:maker-scaffold_18-snap-gene-2.57-mRNA-1 protein AED:0.13 eAED:0.21 QI:0/0/0/1/0/0/2/0/400
MKRFARSARFLSLAKEKLVLSKYAVLFKQGSGVQFIPDFNQLQLAKLYTKLQMNLSKLELRFENILVEETDQVKDRIKVPRGVYSYGSPGTGKTFMLDLFHTSSLESGLRVKRFHYYDLKAQVASANKSKHIKSDIKKFVEELKIDKVLTVCIDELILDNISDVSIFNEFLIQLLGTGIVPVITSNFSIRELYTGDSKTFFSSLFSNLETYCQVVNLNNQDYRTIPKSEKQQGPKIMLQNQHIGGNYCEVELLPKFNFCLPFGRELDGDSFYVALVDPNPELRIGYSTLFSDKEPALSSADFYQLTSSFKNITILDFPQFDVFLLKNHLNELKRFVSFIDVAYEKKNCIFLDSKQSEKIENLLDIICRFQIELSKNVDDYESLIKGTKRLTSRLQEMKDQ